MRCSIIEKVYIVNRLNKINIQDLILFVLFAFMPIEKCDLFFHKIWNLVGFQLKIKSMRVHISNIKVRVTACKNVQFRSEHLATLI